MDHNDFEMQKDKTFNGNFEEETQKDELNVFRILRDRNQRGLSLCCLAGKDIIEKNNKQSAGKGVMRKIIIVDLS